MKIFKFGGASVKDSQGVINVAKVLDNQGFDNCILVVSAMGKTTNALEKLVEKTFEKSATEKDFDDLKKFHFNITNELFKKDNNVYNALEKIFFNLESFILNSNSDHYNYLYDQIVSVGELLSSTILSHYLNSVGYTNELIYAKDYIKTDSSFREGKVNWEKTELKISKLDSHKSYVTQGFIGADETDHYTTLGREGSDYSAAIFAYCLNADSLTIWKDVPGVMTGDPNQFKNVKLLSNLSYEEAIEMAYYGASIIHPKTLQPLKQKHIPFYVKSFLDPSQPGTKVSVTENNQLEESFILKRNQILVTIATKDFSFIAENHISFIFNLLATYRIKVSLIQNSAISLALCLEDPYHRSKELIKELEKSFVIKKVQDAQLYTVRNADVTNFEKYYPKETILLEQMAKNTIQIITLS